MNLQIFRKNIGRTFQFHPIPRRDTAQGSYDSEFNLWIFKGETADKKGFTFQNAISDHPPLIIEAIYVRNYDAPETLTLRGQVVMKKDSVSFEPFRPILSSTPLTKLSLFIKHNPEDSATICPPLTGPIELMVVNQGEQTVRDFRSIIYVPASFQEEHNPLDPRRLERDGEMTLNGEDYAFYKILTAEPLYKSDPVTIGILHLRAEPGDYVFRWQIRCDGGVFPTEDDLGSIKVKVISGSELMGEAWDHFGKPSDDS